MKRTVLTIICIAVFASITSAQSYRNSQYYNPRTGGLNYNQRPTSPSRQQTIAPSLSRSYGSVLSNSYFGFRVGPSFSRVSSDDVYLNGSSMRTGLNIGVVGGWNMSRFAPLYFETGLFYTEKGGKGKNSIDGSRFTTNLGYLEVPLQFKCIYYVAPNISLQPFAGGYLSLGVAGKIKDFGDRTAYDSFSDSSAAFKRFDGGLRFGCGVGYEMLYLDLTYDLGLANIGHDDFDKASNRTLMLNLGVNF